MGLLYYWIYQCLAHSIAPKQTCDNNYVRSPITNPWESMIHPNAPLKPILHNQIDYSLAVFASLRKMNVRHLRDLEFEFSWIE